MEAGIFNTVFTDADREILASYFNLADAVADIIGPYCEVVIHSLENINCSLVKIVNGHHTGRTIGSPITDMGLKTLKHYKKNQTTTPKHYFSYSKYGALIKSITCIITRQNGTPIGLFCINMNVSVPFPDIIKTFLPNIEMNHTPLTLAVENFSADSKEVIENTLEQILKEVWNDSSINIKNKNKATVQLLHEGGIFEFKEAVAIVSNRLGITRHAIYKFLREFKTINHNEHLMN